MFFTPIMLLAKNLTYKMLSYTPKFLKLQLFRQLLDCYDILCIVTEHTSWSVGKKLKWRGVIQRIRKPKTKKFSAIYIRPITVKAFPNIVCNCIFVPKKFIKGNTVYFIWKISCYSWWCIPQLYIAITLKNSKFNCWMTYLTWNLFVCRKPG